MVIGNINQNHISFFFKTPYVRDVAPWIAHWIKMALDGLSRYAMELNGVALYSMVFVDIRWYSLVFVGIRWYSLIFID